MIDICYNLLKGVLIMLNKLFKKKSTNHQTELTVHDRASILNNMQSSKDDISEYLNLKTLESMQSKASHPFD